MNARVIPPVAAAADFIVPSDDVRWCAALAESLSVCCVAPSARRLDEVKALLDAPPLVMLPMAWDDLIQAGRAWLVLVTADPGTPFKGQRLIEAALRDKPVPVPSWAERFR